MKNKQTTFYCFSPPVMLATFVIELLMIVYVVWRYKLSVLTRLSTAILTSLAVFQLAEYNVCGGMGLNAQLWSRIGYVSIALLPALGIHITHTIARKKPGVIVLIAYVSSLLWILLFGFGQRAFSGYLCGGNYVIFQLKAPLGDMFFVWYYSLLLLTIWKAINWLKTSDRHANKALKSQIIGYCLFMIPTSLINLIYPITLHGIPSIMCGFAILFAFTIVFGIMPLEKHRKT